MAAYQYIYVMKGMSKIYPGGKEILKDVWLSFLPGAKIGVLGPNGAGKSTVLRIMAGIDKEFGGEAWVAEGAKVGYLAQEPQLDETKTVMENVIEAMGDPVHLVGHSFGGLVTRETVIAEPSLVESYTLMSSGPAAIGGGLRRNYPAGATVRLHEAAMEIEAASAGNWGNRIRLELRPEATATLATGSVAKQFA